MRFTYVQGVRAMAPILLGVIPMALVTGVAAVKCGMTQDQALISSIIMYAAAAQLVAYEMLGQGADGVLIFVTAVILNLRFLLYSAGIAPHLKSAGWTQRFLGAYTLSDQAFGITMVQHQKDTSKTCTDFYLGAAVFMWAVYQMGAAMGIFLGAKISPDLSLDFAIPLTFSALVVPLLVKKEIIITAVTSAVVALLLSGLPNNAGFFVASLTGIICGLVYKTFFAGEVQNDR